MKEDKKASNLLGERLRELRKQKNLTQDELAKLISTSRSSLTYWELGKRNPDFVTLKKLANYFNVSTDYLLGRTDNPYYLLPDADSIDYDESIPIPIYGEVRAGKPMFAHEELLGYEYLPKDFARGGDYFFLRVKGDSMINEGIKENDLVLVRKQPVLENGQIGVVIVNNEATIKKFYRNGNVIILKPENPAYEPKAYPIENVYIVGRVVKSIRDHR